jgi:arabinofuranosyltransferase
MTWPIALGSLLLLGLLLAHGAFYRFLTDDAFISFRYARNFAHGHGLVFNPGFERVEGYSNFLWVVVLGGLDRLGFAPESASLALGFLSTILLFILVVGFAARTPAARGREWLVLVPAAFLAATRSIAVWTTSGLETRFFEVLVVGATLRLALEVEGGVEGTRRRPVAVWLFALASLTRPDGILLAVAALSAATAWQFMNRRFRAKELLSSLLPFVLVVGAHFVFRRLYYGAWLPNTYYAKVGGQTWWSAGAGYLAAFALEYAAYLWVPLLVAAILRHRALRTAFVPLLFGSVVLPHALYVASIGGDHFEYRPCDLYFPFVFLLLHDGARHLARTRRGVAWVVLFLVLVLGGLWELPWQSHRQATGEFHAGFPGRASATEEARAYLRPENDPIYRLPGLRAIAAAHRGLLDDLTRQYIGLRAEEHRRFLDTVAPEGRRLAELVRQGLLPRDAYLAIDCVGAIPYYSGLRILDRRGLTDAAVAHTASGPRRLMAHEKSATLEDAKGRGVDLWAADPVHVLLPRSSVRMAVVLLDAISRGSGALAAEVGGGDYLVCELPLGLEHASRRMPRLRFRRVDDDEFLSGFLAVTIAESRAALTRNPGDRAIRQRLASLLLLEQRYAARRGR